MPWLWYLSVYQYVITPQGKIGRIGAPGCKGDPGDKVHLVCLFHVHAAAFKREPTVLLIWNLSEFQFWEISFLCIIYDYLDQTKYCMRVAESAIHYIKQWKRVNRTAESFCFCLWKGPDGHPGDAGDAGPPGEKGSKVCNESKQGYISLLYLVGS